MRSVPSNWLDLAKPACTLCTGRLHSPEFTSGSNVEKQLFNEFELVCLSSVLKGCYLHDYTFLGCG